MCTHTQARQALKLKLTTLSAIEFDALWQALSQFIAHEEALEGLPEYRPRLVAAAREVCGKLDAVVASLAESEL